MLTFSFKLSEKGYDSHTSIPNSLEVESQHFNPLVIHSLENSELEQSQQ